MFLHRPMFDSLWYIHSMSGLLFSNRKEPRFCQHWMNFQCILLSERAQTQKSRYWVISFTCILQKAKNYGRKTDRGLWRVGAEKGADCRGAQKNFRGDGNVLHLDCGGGYTTVHVYQNSWKRTLRVNFTKWKLHFKYATEQRNRFLKASFLPYSICQLQFRNPC